MTDALDRIAAALERIADVAEAWAQPRLLVTPPEPPEPDWRMPTEAPRVYRLSGDAPVVAER